MNVSLNPTAAELEHAEPPGSRFTADRITRGKRYAQTGHHALLDCFGVVEFHRHPELDARPLERALRNTSGRGSCFSHEQRLIGKRLGNDVPPPGPFVSWRDDEHQLIKHPCGQTFLARANAMSSHDAEIEFALSDPLLDNLRIGNLELQIYAGIPCAKRGDDTGHHIEPWCRAGADQERPVSQTIELRDRLARFFDRGHNA